MESASIGEYSFCFKVVLFESGSFPSTAARAEKRLDETTRMRNESMYDVSISTVRSVSGFAVDVLKFGPLFTVNHCPFLLPNISSRY